MSKVLFFSPYSLLWEHAFPEALVADSLKKEGFEVIYVNCGGCLDSYCTSMSAKNLAIDDKSGKINTCKDCNKARKFLVKQFNFKSYLLKDWIDQNIYAEVDKLLQSISKENFMDFEINGIKLGKMAVYEILLKYKRITLNFSDIEWQHYILFLKSTLITYFGAHKIIKNENPDSIIVYNSLYTGNAVFCSIAKNLNITQYFMHAGTNLSNQLGSLMIGKNFTWSFLKELVCRWDKYKFLTFSKSDYELVTNHFLALLDASNIFVYSTKKSKEFFDIRKYFGISENQKIIVASMSSYDERFAVETVEAFNNEYSLIFPKQVDWLYEIIEWFKLHPEYFLIIRVHPREFPNRRDSMMSEHARLLQNLFLNLPLNVKIDWPENKVSIYDLALETDVFLNAWSSVGKEMSLLGIPVVSYSEELLLYPSELNYIGNTKEKYFKSIEDALKEGWSEDKLIKSFRWFALEFYSQLKINESYLWNRKSSKNLFFRICRKIYKMVFIDIKMVKDCKNRKEKLSSSHIISEVFKNHLEMPLDVYGFENKLSLIEEKNILKNEVSKLLSRFGGDNLERVLKTNLGRNLQKFVGG